jgi:predicted ribosome quality control (RQC) complex YloA/Tae2 family protein
MALDGFVVRAIVHELTSLIGARIGKIYQPTDSDIVLQMRSSGSAKLLLSANLTFPRVHITERTSPNPTEPPMFCMLLRKHCEGGVIEAVEQVGAERIIRLHIRQRDELGDINTKVLIIEIMGRHSNLVLLDPRTNTVLDGIHHVTPAVSSFRVILPGVTYIAPPDQHKSDPFDLSQAEFTALLAPAAVRENGEPDSTDTQVDGPLLPASPRQQEQALVAGIGGMSPLIAREIVSRAQTLAAATIDPGSVGQTTGNPMEETALTPTSQQVWASFTAIREELLAGHYYPAVKSEEQSGKLFFSVIPLTHIQGTEQIFDSVSACLEYFYSEKAERDTVKQRTADLKRILQNEKNKNLKKLDKLQETLEEAKDADRFRVLGELLTASLHVMQKGAKSIEVINYYDEEQQPVTIALDPLLTPIENSQRYFRKYTKAKKSLIAVNEQLDVTRQELVYLDNLLQQLSTASLTDIEEIRDELVEQHYLRDRRKKQPKKKKKDARPSLTCYTSTEGIPVYVGKNNLQNEYLTNRLAQPGDTWLHTKDIPGSHVVIRSTTFGEDTLLEAAQLAAYYSQARDSSSVPVDYTLIRHVRKPNGAKPGFVIYDRQKTLFATPDETLIKKLKSVQA